MSGPLPSGEFVGGQAKGMLSWGGLTPQLFSLVGVILT